MPSIYVVNFKAKGKIVRIMDPERDLQMCVKQPDNLPDSFQHEVLNIYSKSFQITVANSLEEQQISPEWTTLSLSVKKQL